MFITEILSKNTINHNFCVKNKIVSLKNENADIGLARDGKKSENVVYTCG